MVGRNNWIFLGSPKAGGERASVFYTLVQSAKRLGINPFEYLSDVLERIGGLKHSDIDELTPLCWKIAHSGASQNTLS